LSCWSITNHSAQARMLKIAEAFTRQSIDAHFGAGS
jgi:hypothetical protein